ncbi:MULTISPECIES: hypothetical protein [unclassified Microbulbifer]|uniref:hypothetical protein n=1 Tax=unclassified Microbulbifer TaxID=2619833 RepID=UPI0027E4E065|nr:MULTISPECIES: hypothetical protein [unclassified Microbulbifer]
MIGIGNLQIVEDIEDGVTPEMIVPQHALDDLAAALVKSGVQILILGCTHFDYFWPTATASACSCPWSACLSYCASGCPERPDYPINPVIQAHRGKLLERHANS